MVEEEDRENGDRSGAVLRAQRLVRQYVPEAVSLSDELIAERRVEARREDEETK